MRAFSRSERAELRCDCTGLDDRAPRFDWSADRADGSAAGFVKTSSRPDKAELIGLKGIEVRSYGRASDGRVADGSSTDGNTSEGRPIDERPADERPIDGRAADERSKDETCGCCRLSNPGSNDGKDSRSFPICDKAEGKTAGFVSASPMFDRIDSMTFDGSAANPESTFESTEGTAFVLVRRSPTSETTCESSDGTALVLVRRLLACETSVASGFVGTGSDGRPVSGG